MQSLVDLFPSFSFFPTTRPSFSPFFLYQEIQKNNIRLPRNHLVRFLIIISEVVSFLNVNYITFVSFTTLTTIDTPIYLFISSSLLKI